MQLTMCGLFTVPHFGENDGDGDYNNGECVEMGTAYVGTPGRAEVKTISRECGWDGVV